MTFSRQPNESEDDYFERVIVPAVGEGLLHISFGVNATSGSRRQRLFDGAANEGWQIELDESSQPAFIVANLKPQTEKLREAEQTARSICSDSGYDYICCSYYVELQLDSPDDIL